jgi:hypothetical protein
VEAFVVALQHAMYIRFTTGKIHDKTLYEVGVFQAAYALKKQGALPDYEEARLCELLDWFSLNLEKPNRFTISKPPFYRKENRAISWFKDTSTDYIANIRDIVSILNQHGIHTRMIQTDRPGYIVYEDAHQVVAEPFSDSQFRSILYVLSQLMRARVLLKKSEKAAQF